MYMTIHACSSTGYNNGYWWRCIFRLVPTAGMKGYCVVCRFHSISHHLKYYGTGHLIYITYMVSIGIGAVELVAYYILNWIAPEHIQKKKYTIPLTTTMNMIIFMSLIKVSRNCCIKDSLLDKIVKRDFLLSAINLKRYDGLRYVWF